MVNRKITITHPGGASVVYIVKVDPRTGMATQEDADVESARIVEMAMEAGATADVKEI